MDHSCYQGKKLPQDSVASALLLCAEMLGRVQISDECGGEEGMYQVKRGPDAVRV